MHFEKRTGAGSSSNNYNNSGTDLCTPEQLEKLVESVVSSKLEDLFSINKDDNDSRGDLLRQVKPVLTWVFRSLL